MGLLFSHENGGFGAISVTERSSPSSILKVFKWNVTYRIGFCETFYVKWRQPNPSVFSKTKLTLGRAHDVILWDLFGSIHSWNRSFHGFFNFLYGPVRKNRRRHWKEGLKNVATLRSCIFIRLFQQIALKLGNFTNFKALFSVASTDFPELVHVKSWKKTMKRSIGWKRTYAVSMGVVSCGRAHTTRRF